MISLIAIIPGMFVFDQFHDPKWMYVHVSDPLLLKTNNKSVQSMINSPFIQRKKKSDKIAPVNTFADYLEQVFISYIEKRLQDVYRVDII